MFTKNIKMAYCIQYMYICTNTTDNIIFERLGNESAALKAETLDHLAVSPYYTVIIHLCPITF